MTSNEFKSRLRKQFGLRKPWFGEDPIRLFDKDYFIPSLDWLDNQIQLAMQKLAAEGLIPSEHYEPNRADCETWSLWIIAEVTKAWARLKRGTTPYEALTLGWLIVPGHAMVIGETEQGAGIWDYGVLQPGWSGQIIEIDCK